MAERGRRAGPGWRAGWLLLALAALAGCNRPRPATVRIAVHAGPLSLDPHLSNEILTLSLLSNVYEGLTTLDPELRVVPALASRWENPDDLTWRFHLRPGARFHDGREVEAEDVVSSLERVRGHPRSDFASYLVEVDRVRALDRLAVELHLRRPFAGLLNKLAFLAVLPRGSPPEIVSPVGSGPYRFVSYRRGESLRLTPASPGGPTLALEFLPVPDPAERVRRLLDGGVDVVQDVAPADAGRLRQDPAVRLLTVPSTVVEYLLMRVGDPRFADPRVREAVDLALDREALARDALGGHGAPLGQLVAPGVFGFDPGLVPPARDLPRARRLLAEAGFPLGTELTLEFREGRCGEAVARQLREAGLRVRARACPWGEVYARLQRREVGFYYGGVAATSADASDVLDSSLHTVDPGRGYGNTNYGGLADPELDRTIELAAASRDPAARGALLQKAMRQALAERRLLPVLTRLDLYAARAGLEWRPRADRMLYGREMRWR